MSLSITTQMFMNVSKMQKRHLDMFIVFVALNLEVKVVVTSKVMEQLILLDFARLNVARL